MRREALTTANDLGSANNDGTYVNTPTQGVAGPITSDPSDTACTFTLTSSECVTTTDNAAYDVVDTFTYEAWVKVTGVPAAQWGIRSMGNNTGYMRISTTRRVALLKAGVGVLGTSTAINSDTWRHIVWTKTGATNVLYIDGSVATPSIANQTMVNSMLGIGIGCDKNTTPANVEFMNGSIDEVAIYGTVLSQARVQAHFAAATSGGGSRRL